MILAILTSLWLAAGSNAASLEADLDGEGSILKMTAAARGKGLRLEVFDAQGRLLVRLDTAPRETAPARVSLTSGSMPGGGELIEVVRASADGSEECHSLWRYRDRTLTAVPVIGRTGALAECGAPDGWSYRWEGDEKTPVEYVRERTRVVADGSHHQKESYRYAGFRAELDAKRSRSEINGVLIPGWLNVILYPRPALERLTRRYDLSFVRESPRLRFEADPEKGVFAATLERPSRSDRLLVTSAEPGERNDKLNLTLGSDSKRAEVWLSADRMLPVEARLKGLGDDVVAPFGVVTAYRGAALEAYPTAEEEVAVQALSGTWDARDGERLEVQVVSTSPTVLRLSGSEFLLDATRAPAGTDLLLMPRNEKNPPLAITLRGPDIFARTKASCASASPCRVDGDAKVFHRLGSSVMVR
jgi:hypothetical protein